MTKPNVHFCHCRSYGHDPTTFAALLRNKGYSPPPLTKPREDYHKGLYCWAVNDSDFDLYLDMVIATRGRRFAWVELGLGASAIAVDRVTQFNWTMGYSDEPPISVPFDPERHCLVRMVLLATMRRSFEEPRFEVVVSGPVVLHDIYPGSSLPAGWEWETLDD